MPTMSEENAINQEVSRNVTRLLQQSILQLCNEHVDYSRTLQVLGVICVTVDEKQHELVVKVNNTLKRISPIVGPNEDSPSVYQSSVTPGKRAGFSGAISTPCNLSMMPGIYSTPNSGNNQSLFSPVLDIALADVDSVAHVKVEKDDDHLVNEGDCDATTSRGDDHELSELVRNTDETGSRARQHGRKQIKPVRRTSINNLGASVQDEDNVTTVEPMDPDEEPNEDSDDVLAAIIREFPGVTESDISCSVASSSVPILSPFAHRRKKKKLSGGDFKARRNLTDQFGDSSGIPQSYISSDHDGIARQITEDGDVNGQDAVSNERVFVKQEPEDDDDVNNSDRLVIDTDNQETGSKFNNTSFISGQDGVLNFSLGAMNSFPSSIAMGSTVDTKNSTACSAIVPTNGMNGPAKNEVVAFYPSLEFLLNRSSGGTIDLSSFNKGFVTIGNPVSNTLQMNPMGTFSLVNSLSNGIPLALNQSRILVSGGSFGNQTLGASSLVGTSTARGLSVGATNLPVGLRKKRIRRVLGAVDRIRSRVRLTPAGIRPKLPGMNQDGSMNGRKVDGTLVVDAMNNPDGRKRPRRTVTATSYELTKDEILEYMGSGTTPITGPGGSPGEGIFRCRLCTDVTLELSSYFAHTVASHSAYICHQCGHCFTTKSSLLRHRPIHTGVRRFACSICRKTFYRKDKCKAHIKQHFAEPSSTTSSGSVSTPLSVVPDAPAKEHQLAQLLPKPVTQIMFV